MTLTQPPPSPNLTGHQCINTISSESPPDLANFTYITRRSHEPGISLHTEQEFLVSCSCTDDCTDHMTCACWQLTIQEAQVVKGTNHSVGYVHGRMKRMQHAAYVASSALTLSGPFHSFRVYSFLNCDLLLWQLPTGSTSVTSGAAAGHGVPTGLSRMGYSTDCKSTRPATCEHTHTHTHTHTHRSVVPLNCRGWGLRTLDDISAGSFICTYIGHIYTEQGGEEVMRGRAGRRI